MPVSHLALIVSNVSAATSFYLKALQPLGYNYIGRQGDSIGFGVTEAEFFLCPAKNGQQVTPTHIAFAADNRLVVRDCYTAALNAGARPSGPPGYRNDDCTCFNAAVEDYDGNTIEFIFRESSHNSRHQADPTPSDNTIARTYSNRNSPRNYVDTVTSFANKAQSTAQTALDLASSASQSFRKSGTPTPGIVRSRTEPITSSDGAAAKTVMGTLLGVAAGAVFTYAIARSERDNAADDARFAASMRSRENQTRYGEEKSSRSNRSPPTLSSRTMRPQIEAPSSRYSSSTRLPFSRSRTDDAIEYRPRSSSVGRSQRFSMRRASTMPAELDDEYRDKTSSRYSSRRRSLDDSPPSRHDSVMSARSHRSHRRSSFSKTSTAKPSKRGTQYESAANVPLPSSRATSYYTIDERNSRASKSRSYVPAAQFPLPPSRTASYLSGASVPIPRSEYRGGYTDMAEDSDGINDMDSVVPDDSISCVDFSRSKKKNSGSHKRSSDKSSRHGSKRSEADSERTIRPAKGSVSQRSMRILPVRSKEEYHSSKSGRRSAATYA